jgi:predicted dehydrogenase/threonine dehydrogenase-like Zn-dependent dehydrogenase
MLVEFGKAGYLEKARQKPDKVKQVLDKIKTDGLMPTVEAVLNKLDEPIPIGYINSGEIIEIGGDVEGFNIGDRVVSNGPHAEYVCVPKNYVAKIPDSVSYEEACFAIIGSIGLQGIRLAAPMLGENIVVFGLGLIGIITAEMLKANGCNVIGFDVDDAKINICRNKGIKAYNVRNENNPVKIVEGLTVGVGADAVIITASSSSNDIISQSAQMCRQRGRIILVGVVGLNIVRDDFYKKELTFQVASSFGPGKYDEKYESKGIDYPLPFVRWTANRNIKAVLESIETGKIEIKSLITETVDLNEYNQIYNNIKNSRSIASIIKYYDSPQKESIVKITEKEFVGKKGVMGIIGAGNFTKMTVMPIMKQLKADIKYISSAGGVTGTALAKKYGIANSITDINYILKDEEVDSVVITTRHNQHASMVIKGLSAGKNVFVEKPLALNKEELKEVIAYVESSQKNIMVGFNRRFSPFIKKTKELLGGSNNPINVIATMNAGHIPKEVWVHDLKVGGGRIIGEACHYIDLISFLTNSKIKKVSMSALGNSPEENTDNAVITLKYENGSLGVINYFSNGSKAYSKERIEVYSLDRTIVIDNFKKMKAWGFKGFSSMKGRQDKGHKEQFRAYIEFLQKGGKPLIPFGELVNTSLSSFAAIESLMTAKVVEVE